MYVERDMVEEVEAGRVSRSRSRSRERRGKVKKGRRLLLKQSLSVASREPGTSSGSDRSLDYVITSLVTHSKIIPLFFLAEIGRAHV